MPSYKKHDIIKESKRFLKSINHNDISPHDYAVIDHILSQQISDIDTLQLIDKVLRKYPDLVSRHNISYPRVEEKAKDRAQKKRILNFEIVGNIIKAHMPWFGKELFTKVKDELKSLGFQFGGNENPVWWILVKDKAILVKIKNSDIINQVGYEIDSSKEHILLEKIQQTKKQEQKLLKLSSSPESDIEVEGLNGQLYPFQKVSLEFSNHKNSLLIADSMGLGKTIQGLAIMEYHDLYPSVVVCPGHLKQNWQKEINNWLPNKTTHILQSGRKIREADIYIISYGSINTFGDFLKKKKLRLTIADESHYAKNYKAKRTKALQKYLSYPKRKIAMTGTPIVNEPAEIISQLNFLGVLNAHFGGLNKFLNRYAPATSNGIWTTRTSANEEELQYELRKSCMVRRKKEDVLSELPEKTRQVIFLPLSDYKSYFSVERDIVNWIAKKIKEEGKFTDSQANFLANYKKDQIGDAAEELVKIEYLKQASIEYKLPAVMDWIDDALKQTNKMVVFAHHSIVLEKLEEKYKKKAVILKSGMNDKTNEFVDRFQNDKDTQLFITSLGVGGTGLTLTAADTMAIIELGWNPATHNQAEDRIHRIGQENHVHIYYLLGDMTIDEYIYDLILNKGEIIDKAMNAQKLLDMIKEKQRKINIS